MRVVMRDVSLPLALHARTVSFFIRPNRMKLFLEKVGNCSLGLVETGKSCANFYFNIFTFRRYSNDTASPRHRLYTDL